MLSGAQPLAIVVTVQVTSSAEFARIVRDIEAGEVVRISHPVPTRRLRELKRALEMSDLPVVCFLGDPTGTIPCYGSAPMSNTTLTVTRSDFSV